MNTDTPWRILTKEVCQFLDRNSPKRIQPDYWHNKLLNRVTIEYWYKLAIPRINNSFPIKLDTRAWKTYSSAWVFPSSIRTSCLSSKKSLRASRRKRFKCRRKTRSRTSLSRWSIGRECSSKSGSKSVGSSHMVRSTSWRSVRSWRSLPRTSSCSKTTR